MVWTYDFIFMAYRNQDFRKQLEDAIASSSDLVIATELHKLSFCTKEQTVLVTPNPECHSPFTVKIIPTKIAYSALTKMLLDAWEHIKPGEITIVS